MVNDKSSKTDITNSITDQGGDDTDPLEHKSLTSQIVRYETGEGSEEETIALFQELINTGMAWQLQGHYGRMAAHLIEQGVCNEALPRDK